MLLSPNDFGLTLERKMKLTKRSLLVLTVLLLRVPVVAQEPSADAILEKTKETYSALETYQAEGSIQSDINTGVSRVQQSSTFSILLKKPNLYLISWNQTVGPMAQSGAVWSDGNQSYLYMGAMNAYSKMASDEIALGGATGISGGAAYSIPSLFLSVFKGQPSPLARLKNPQIEKSESIAGEECFVISAPSSVSKKETYWISKESHLIRQYSRSFEPPEGGAVIPEMTDADLEEALKGLGQEVNEETKKKMRQTMEKTRSMMKTMKLKGTSIETHKKVASPGLDNSDFEYTPPQGTVLKESLFGGFLGGQ